MVAECLMTEAVLQGMANSRQREVSNRISKEKNLEENCPV
jgi:ribosomal protein L34E